jgi:hypothetical protein
MPRLPQLAEGNNTMHSSSSSSSSQGWGMCLGQQQPSPAIHHLLVLQPFQQVCLRLTRLLLRCL